MKSSGGLIVLGIAALGIGAIVLSSPSSARATPSPGPNPTPTPPGPDRPVQSRPLATERAAYMRIAQQQLKDMGYRITAVDGIVGPETQAATRAFVADHQAQVEATRSTYGSLRPEIGLMYLIDDVYRRSFGLPSASA